MFEYLWQIICVLHYMLARSNTVKINDLGLIYYSGKAVLIRLPECDQNWNVAKKKTKTNNKKTTLSFLPTTMTIQGLSSGVVVIETYLTVRVNSQSSCQLHTGSPWPRINSKDPLRGTHIEKLVNTADSHFLMLWWYQVPCQGTHANHYREVSWKQASFRTFTQDVADWDPSKSTRNFHLWSYRETTAQDSHVKL